MNKKTFQQGEIWLSEFPPSKEARKPIRPVLIISNNIQNEYDEWIVVVPITIEDIDNIEPFEFYVENSKEYGLDYPSKIQFIYPFTIDKTRLKKYLGVLNRKLVGEVKKA